VAFGQVGDLSAIQRDHDDIINLNFVRKSKDNRDEIEDPS
jgi:hypothetical protein